MTDSELTILSFIKDGLNYPYIIEKVIDNKEMRDYFELSFSSIYFLINTLEEKKLVESFKSFGKNKVSKKAVKITENGLELLKESFISRFSAKPLVSHPLDYLLYHCHHLTSRELKAGLNRYSKEAEKIYLYFSQKYEEKKASQSLEIGEELVMSHFLARLKSEIDWAKEARNTLSSEKNIDELLRKQKEKVQDYFKNIVME